MSKWLCPGSNRLVFIPDLKGLPQYKLDAFRALTDGLSPLLLKGTTVERHAC